MLQASVINKGPMLLGRGRMPALLGRSRMPVMLADSGDDDADYSTEGGAYASEDAAYEPGGAYYSSVAPTTTTAGGVPAGSTGANANANTTGAIANAIAASMLTANSVINRAPTTQCPTGTLWNASIGQCYPVSTTLPYGSTSPYAGAAACPYGIGPTGQCNLTPVTSYTTYLPYLIGGAVLLGVFAFAMK